jgi:hypothetical protein
MVPLVGFVGELKMIEMANSFLMTSRNWEFVADR